MQFFSLPLAVVAHCLASGAPKLLCNLHLCIDFFLHFVGVEDFLYAALRVTCARIFVACDAADRRLRRAAGIAAVFTDTGAGAAGDELAIEADARTEVDAYAASFVVGVVVYVAGGACAADGEVVFVVVDGSLGAGDGAAVEVGVLCDGDVEALVCGLDSGLFGHAGVVAVNFVFAGAEVAADVAVRTDCEAAADAVLFAVELAGVLQALDVEVTTDIGSDLRGFDDGAFQCGVVA